MRIGPIEIIWHGFRSVGKECQDLVKADRFVDAVKLFRTQHGCSLKDARDAVVEYRDSLPRV